MAKSTVSSQSSPYRLNLPPADSRLGGLEDLLVSEDDLEDVGVVLELPELLELLEVHRAW